MAWVLPEHARDRVESMWLDRAMAAYEPPTARFFVRRKDPHANPVGHTLATELAVVLDGLLAGAVRPGDPALFGDGRRGGAGVGAGPSSSPPCVSPDVGGAPSTERVAQAIEAVARIRAVQGLRAGPGLAFVLELKACVRDVLAAGEARGAGAGAPPSRDDLEALDAAIDAVALAAFDAFVRTRERISELRVVEAKRNVATLIRRWETFYEARPGDPPPPEIAALAATEGAP